MASLGTIRGGHVQKNMSLQAEKLKKKHHSRVSYTNENRKRDGEEGGSSRKKGGRRKEGFAKWTLPRTHMAQDFFIRLLLRTGKAAVLGWPATPTAFRRSRGLLPPQEGCPRERHRYKSSVSLSVARILLLKNTARAFVAIRIIDCILGNIAKAKMLRQFPVGAFRISLTISFERTMRIRVLGDHNFKRTFDSRGCDFWTMVLHIALPVFKSHLHLP